MSTFYIFETKVKSHYKYGMTEKQNPYDRIKRYSGLNKCSRLVTMYSVDDGRKEEKNFFNFLKLMNIDIFSGKEFFFYTGDIETLILKYKSSGKIIPTITNDKYRLIYKPNSHFPLKKAKQSISKSELEYYINTNNIITKNVRICKSCGKKPNGCRKKTNQCCSAYSQTNCDCFCIWYIK